MKGFYLSSEFPFWLYNILTFGVIAAVFVFTALH